MGKNRSDTTSTKSFERDDNPRHLSLKGYRLIIVKGPARDSELDLTGSKVRIGSDKANDLAVPDETVSRSHCELERFGDAYLLRDLGSTNGTLLDGTVVREAFIKPGSLIELGGTSIKVQSQSENFTVQPYDKEELGFLKGRSERMREVFAIINRVAPTDATVLINGETGTGKELAARTTHKLSRRSDAPFVVFDCSAVAPNLIESELFGHVKGSFTGAVADRRGAFEMASSGTLFLDEVGELTEELQPKLLRAIEHKEIRRVGSEKSLRVDVRLIAATNRTLAEEVRAGRFREDLFFRLSVIPLTMPSLRQRREDIPFLTELFLEELREKLGPTMKVKSMGKKAMEILMEHAWPGNVRELRNAIEGAVAMAETSKLEPKDFIFFSRAGGKTDGSSLEESGLIGKSLEQVEKTVIEGTLKSLKGNKMATAKTLGIAYSTLYEKIKKYGIEN